MNIKSIGFMPLSTINNDASLYMASKTDNAVLYAARGIKYGGIDMNKSGKEKAIELLEASNTTLKADQSETW